MVGNNWSANYYPFGEVASMTGSTSDTRFDFTGQERDQGTGLMYFGARYYDPEIGRWLGVDPILSKETQGFLISNGLLSVSPYNYAFNRPTVLTDPDGECPQCVGGFLIGAGLDIAGQFLQSKSNSERSLSGFIDFVQSGELDVTQTLISGAIGATGAGLSLQIGKVIGGTTAKAILGRATANAVGNSTIGAGVDFVQGTDFNSTKAGLNLVGGAAGSVTGDLIKAAGKIIISEGIVLGGEALPAQFAKDFAKSLPAVETVVNPKVQAFSNTASNFLSNSANVIPPKDDEEKQ